MAYDNTDSGALFRNKDKQEERHPDYRGSLNVGGTEYWISSWLKTSKAGEKYMSLSVQPKVAKPVASKSIQQEEAFDDDVPF